MPKAHIIGLGKSGNAAARLLKVQGWEVTVSDRNTSESLQRQCRPLIDEGIAVKLGESFDPHSAPDLVVVSPGVPWDLPALETARSLGIETVGEMELAWQNLRDVPWVGITGTNGKTTTTALTAQIFEVAGLKAPACGNIGNAACELALQRQQDPSMALDWVIAEISSFQIESSTRLAPKIGLWTTFTPDHLNRHYTLENYYEIKASLMDRSEVQIFNGDDPYLRRTAGDRWPDARWTSVKGYQDLLGDRTCGVHIEGDWVMYDGEAIAPVGSLKMVGDHNRQNLLMAVAAAKLAGIDKDAIAKGIATFPGVPHRLEEVSTWMGIRWINDSKATNYDAAEVGLAAVEAPAILIAGGEAKAGDDTRWIETIHQKAATVLLIGSAAELFARRLQESQYNKIEIVETLENAIPRAAELASQLQVKTVLLSPACASFDQYRSFEHRGDRFRELCLGMMG